MSTEAETPSTEPNRSGLKPWRKGQSGNPNGRRAKGLATAERLRNALVDELPDILEGIVKAAKNGDMQAARTILDRVLPPLKAIEVPVSLGALEGCLTDQGATVLTAVGAGIISPGQAAQLLQAIAAQAKIVEVDELARRLAEIEKRVGSANGSH